LLDDEDGARQVAGLLLLVVGQLGNAGVDEEDVGQVVDLVLADIRELVHIAVEADIPALVGPVGIGRNVEDFGGLRSQIVVADAET